MENTVWWEAHNPELFKKTRINKELEDALRRKASLKELFDITLPTLEDSFIVTILDGKKVPPIQRELMEAYLDKKGVYYDKRKDKEGMGNS